MTRDEAIQCEMDYCPVGETHPKYIEAGRVIDRYVRLGMLKLDEPKSVENIFDEAVCNLATSARPTQIWDAIHLAGLKVIRK
jgi:hypothetical protein